MVTLDQLMDTQRLDRITVEARQVNFWRTVLTVVAGLLFGIGWLVARAFGVLWLVMAWTATAVRIGWQEGRKARAGQSKRH